MYIRNIDPRAFSSTPDDEKALTKKNKKTFSALDNHLNNPKTKKSKDLNKTASNFAKDPAIRAKNFKADFKGSDKTSSGVSLQIAFGPEVEGFYDQNGYSNLEPEYFKLEPRLSWSPQKMFMKVKKENRSEDFINREMMFSYTKDKRVKMVGKITSYFIHPKRATGMVFIEDVQTFYG